MNAFNESERLETPNVQGKPVAASNPGAEKTGQEGICISKRRGFIAALVAGAFGLFATKTNASPRIVKAEPLKPKHKIQMEMAGEDFHDLRINVPEGFNGQIAIQAEDTKTSIYVYLNGLIVRQATIPAKHCSPLDRVSWESGLNKGVDLADHNERVYRETLSAMKQVGCF